MACAALLLATDIGLSILESRSRLSFLKLISIPSVLVCSLSITSASLSIGFLTATLEPHLRQFNLTPVEVGLCFVTSGAGLAITAVAWGWLSDGKLHPKLLTGVGAIQMVIVYLLIGPAPFIPMKPQLWLCIFAFGLHGLCLGAEVVVPFGDAMRQSVKNGFPNDVGTYGMVAGLWLSCFHLGGFLGPSIGGVLLDAVGFRDASVLVLTIQIIVAVLASAFYWHDRFHKPKSPELCESMLLSESCNFSTSSGASFTFPNITTTNYAGKFK